MKKLEELGVLTPWKAVFDEMNDEESPYRIDVGPCYSLDGQFNKADAKLIAAAPELYEAVYDLLEIVGNVPEYIGVDADTLGKISKAKAALAKAGGEEAKQ